MGHPVPARRGREGSTSAEGAMARRRTCSGSAAATASAPRATAASPAPGSTWAPSSAAAAATPVSTTPAPPGWPATSRATAAQDRAGLRVPLGQWQVPRGTPDPSRPASRSKARCRAPWRSLPAPPPAEPLGHGGRQRWSRRADRGAQGRTAARPAEGHDHLQGHRPAAGDAHLRAAHQRRPRRGGGQPVGPDPGEARRQASTRSAPARSDRLHRPGGRPLPAPARGRLAIRAGQRATARSGHQDRGGAAGG